MPSIHRRRFLFAAAATLTTPWWLPAPAARAQAPGITDVSAKLDWPARVIQLKADPDELTPPVITGLEIHRDGKVIATAGDDHVVRVYSLEDGSQVHRLDAHVDWVRTIDYNRDCTLLASGGNDRRVLLWPTEGIMKPRQLVMHEQAIAAVKFSDDGAKLAVVGFEQTVRMYRVGDGELLWQAAGPCEDLRLWSSHPINNRSPLLVVAGAFVC